MDRPQFSEMLVERRRQLGLSIKQASNVLRLKEEVLIAFEEGDFDSIPKSGYAQGMLSSYARYLGLNPKTIVNQFSTDLFEHERGAGSHEARRRSRQNRDADDGPLYETPQATSIGSSRQRPYVESHGFLPTSGGFAGDMADFATTSEARPRYSSSRQQESSSTSTSSAYPQGRPYTTRIPVSGNVSPLGQAQRQRPVTRSSYGQQDPYGRSYGGSHFSSRDEVTTRRVSSSQYRDDLRLDNDGGSYQAASSSAGRRSSRNIASTQRPNVRRRSSSQERARLRNRSADPGSDGIVGMLGSFFQERSRVVALIIVVLGIVLTATIILSIKSCVSSQESTGRTVTVTSADEQTEDEATQTDEEKRAREEAAAAKAAETESAETERTFEVTVADGEVTWLEIEYDGHSDVAETVTGPWNRTYTVRQSISINVNDTSAVTVTEGGKKLEFDSKASGIGTITIQVSKKSDSSDDSSDDEKKDEKKDDEAKSESDNQQVSESTTEQQTTETPSWLEGYTLAEDGYYYGEDGYFDQYYNFYSY